MDDGTRVLEGPWRETFALMWEAYRVGTIPVGAVVADAEGAVVARGRNRIFDRDGNGQLAWTRLAHAEVNALAGLTPERVYDDLVLYTALEPCALCVGATFAARVGTVRFAAADPYGGAVGRTEPSRDMQAHPVVFDGPQPGWLGLVPELLHIRHFLWRRPANDRVVRFYRETRPDLVEHAAVLPAPPDASTLDALLRLV